MDPNVRLLKSDPPDISRPGTRASDEWGEKGRERSTSSQLQFVFALKRNITWWDQVEDSADASCVVLHNVPRRYLESFVTDSIGVAFGASSSWEKARPQEVLPLKTRVSPSISSSS